MSLLFVAVLLLTGLAGLAIGYRVRSAGTRRTRERVGLYLVVGAWIPAAILFLLAEIAETTDDYLPSLDEPGDTMQSAALVLLLFGVSVTLGYAVGSVVAQRRHPWD